jgi:hypothetical protein
VSRDKLRTVPDFAALNREEILRRAPAVAQAFLRFATEVHLLAPVIAKMLSQPTIRTFIYSRLRRLQMIEDVISELSYFGWLQSKGLAFDFKQLPGDPEGIVKYDGQDLCVEVKTIHRLGVKVSKRIGAANRQIKHAGNDSSGICVIRYPTPLDPRNREQDLTKVIEGIQAVTGSRFNKSVAAIVLQWDEVLVEENAGDIWLFTARGSRLYTHTHARRPLKGNLQDLCPAATAVARILLRPV